MGWDVQLNPSAEAHHVSERLAALLERHADDFDMRYCALIPSDDVLAALRAIVPDGDEDGRVITALVAELEHGNGVELLIGY